MPTTFTHVRHILFVDDDARFLEMIARVMSGLSKGLWVIHTAQNSSQALALIQQNPVGLVVIDVQMPVVDGLQFLTLLNRTYPNLQKVVLTGYANDNYRAACLNNGAELFLEKPASVTEFEAVFTMLNEVVKWRPEEGFRGVLRRVGLEEVLQMECLARNSSVLEVSAGSVRGEVFIRDGTLVHAAVGGQTGEAAFNRLLALRAGEFRLKPFAEPPVQTLSGSWEMLIMEAARQRDEAGALGAPETEAPVPDQPVAPGPTRDTELVRRLAASVRDRETAALLAQARSASDPAPTRIEEVMICSAAGDVLYEWKCNNSDVWVRLLEFVSQRSRQLAQGLALGKFDRLEVRDGDSRLVAQIAPTHGVLIRARSAPSEPPVAATAP